MDNTFIKPMRAQKEIVVKPGFGEQAPLEFKGEGNESSWYPSSNLIVKLKEEKHGKFKRDGDNLSYTHKCSLLDALESKPFELYTLDKRQLIISVDEVISPKTVKKVEGEGMPMVSEEKKGDLFIRFNIVFPEFVPEESKVLLKNALMASE